MRIPNDWPFLLMKAVLAFAFCHQALGYDIALSAFLTVLALHPLTLSIPGMLSLHAVANAPSAEQAVMIALPLSLFIALTWVLRDFSFKPAARPAIGPAPV